MSKIKASVFICALIQILVADARRKGAAGDLYLGSIKLPDYGFRLPLKWRRVHADQHS